MRVYEEVGLSALELWHGIVDGQVIADMPVSSRSYFEALCSLLCHVHQGVAATNDEQDTATLRRAANFQRVILCGGDAQNPTLESVLNERQVAFTWEIDRTGIFAAQRGAVRIFSRLGWSNGVALDLGQTNLKVITKSGNYTVPRDLQRLPLGANALDEATGRARLRLLLGDTMQRFAAESDGVVLGLPVALDREGVARAASYPGLVGEVIPWLHDLFPPGSVLLNDALLAAAGFPPPLPQKTLVLTLGFGIGGALWDI
jgi:hypothetical protein